jgi:acyl carrier protein
MAVFAEVKRIIMEIKDIPEENITLDSTFEEDLKQFPGYSGMLMSLEESTRFKSPRSCRRHETVRDVVEYLEER